MSQQQRAPRVGRAAACLAMAWLLKNHDVWVSELPDASSIDAVVIPRLRPEKRFTVQFKAAFRRKGERKLCVNVSTSDGRRYAAREVDAVIAVDLKSLTFWVLPVPALQGQGRIVLGEKWLTCAYSWEQGVPC